MGRDLLDSRLEALSARVVALEMALIALAPNAPKARLYVSQRFDWACRQMQEQMLDVRVGDEYLRLVEQSLEDFRCMLIADWWLLRMSGSPATHPQGSRAMSRFRKFSSCCL